MKISHGFRAALFAYRHWSAEPGQSRFADRRAAKRTSNAVAQDRHEQAPADSKSRP
jgi:hypothetical protein